MHQTQISEATEKIAQCAIAYLNVLGGNAIRAEPVMESDISSAGISPHHDDAGLPPLLSGNGRVLTQNVFRQRVQDSEIRISTAKKPT